MQGKKHSVFITARNKKIIVSLLDLYGFSYKKRPYGSDNLIGKLLKMIQTDLELYNYAKKVRPDIFLSFGSMYAAHAAFLFGRPHIAFDDTEHSVYQFLLYAPFTKSIYTPSSFRKNLGKKQKRFNGFMELCYLHPRYFKPNLEVLDDLGVTYGQKYIILRFVAWNASHDKGNFGISHQNKLKLVQILSNKFKVFITSEDQLPDDLRKFQIKISPDRIHDAMSFASLYIGESVTMGTESALVGTPAIIVSSLPEMGVPREIEAYGISHWYREWTDDILDTSEKLLNYPKEHFDQIKDEIFNEKLDVTQMMAEMLELKIK